MPSLLEQVAEIEERLKIVAPEGWRVVNDGTDPWVRDDDGVIADCIVTSGGGEASALKRKRQFEKAVHNAELIANAPTDLALLIKAVRVLAEEHTILAVFMKEREDTDRLVELALELDEAKKARQLLIDEGVQE